MARLETLETKSDEAQREQPRDRLRTARAILIGCIVAVVSWTAILLIARGILASH
jgi:hypothetical protein